ncbi:MAG: DUF2147 domain-containing protein [Bacteroidota bacterium]|nr:DUF2147 domain-containing protein [Bacteroidota bacterium]
MLFLSCLTIAYLNKNLDLRKEEAILGRWTHGENSYDLEIYQSGQVFSARIISQGINQIRQLAHQRKNETFDSPILGAPLWVSDLELIQGLSYNDRTRKWDQGIVVDPVSGRMKKAKVWLKGNDTLVLRRFWYLSCFGSNISFRRVVK